MEPGRINKQADIAALCRRFGVSRLEVFGSASVGVLEPASSEYDFIARFAPQPGVSMGRRFVGFSDALEALLERKVDLMTDARSRTPTCAPPSTRRKRRCTTSRLPKHLFDALTTVRLAREFSSSLSFEDFVSNLLVLAKAPLP